MNKLNWTSTSQGKYMFRIAIADNGMRACIFANANEDWDFTFPGAWVQIGNLKKIANIVFVEEASAISWCEQEIEQWIVIPK